MDKITGSVTMAFDKCRGYDALIPATLFLLFLCVVMAGFSIYYKHLYLEQKKLMVGLKTPLEAIQEAE